MSLFKKLCLSFKSLLTIFTNFSDQLSNKIKNKRLFGGKLKKQLIPQSSDNSRPSGANLNHIVELISNSCGLPPRQVRIICIVFLEHIVEAIDNQEKLQLPPLVLLPRDIQNRKPNGNSTLSSVRKTAIIRRTAPIPDQP